MKKLFGILVILFCLLASGCSILKIFDKPPETPVVTKTVTIPRDSLLPCALIPAIEKEATFEGSIKPAYIDLISLYGECSYKQDNSIKIIKELSGSTK